MRDSNRKLIYPGGSTTPDATVSRTASSLLLLATLIQWRGASWPDRTLINVSARLTPSVNILFTATQKQALLESLDETTWIRWDHCIKSHRTKRGKSTTLEEKCVLASYTKCEHFSLVYEFIWICSKYANLRYSCLCYCFSIVCPISCLFFLESPSDLDTLIIIKHVYDVCDNG